MISTDIELQIENNKVIDCITKALYRIRNNKNIDAVEAVLCFCSHVQWYNKFIPHVNTKESIVLLSWLTRHRQLLLFFDKDKNINLQMSHSNGYIKFYDELDVNCKRDRFILNAHIYQFSKF